MHVPSYLLCLFSLLYPLDLATGDEFPGEVERKAKCTAQTLAHKVMWITESRFYGKLFDMKIMLARSFFLNLQPRWEQKILFQSSLETSCASTQLALVHLWSPGLIFFFFFSSLVALQKNCTWDLFSSLFFTSFFHRRKRSENFTVGMAHRWSKRFLFWTTLENYFALR